MDITFVRLMIIAVLLVGACSPQKPRLTVKPGPQNITRAEGTPLPSPSISPTAFQPVESPTVDITQSPTPGAGLSFPVRAAFYYPWFPEGWDQQGINPFTWYHPSSGYYDSGDTQIIQKHIAAMQYGKIQVGITSWWGQQHYTDLRIPALLQAGEPANFSWALYVESEGQGDPTPEAILADLTYIRDQYAGSPAYAKVGGQFLVFVYADANDGCAMASRWKQANTVGAYLVLKVFEGYRSCADQPDGWHQYAPANASDAQDLYSYTISPGFWKATEQEPRLKRDLAQWQSSVRSMVASGAKFQLITTFNEWGEGTAVEEAQEWADPMGYGQYLATLHNDGNVPPEQVLIGAGDIGRCGDGVGQTAALLANYPNATIYTTGDNAYPDATMEDFMNCFNPTWGQYKERILPVPGNHDYRVRDAADYFTYFGAAAGEIGKGYYSYNLGDWHIIALNSNCDKIDGCSDSSAQAAWLKADLAANPTLCTLAYWHHPLYSSGRHGSSSRMQDIWRVLYDAGVDLVLAGHDHNYERFAPQDADGNLDLERGIREFVIGTGGASHYSVSGQEPNSEAVITQVFGLLKLDLRPDGYSWTFLPVEGEIAADEGTGTCH